VFSRSVFSLVLADMPEENDDVITDIPLIESVAAETLMYAAHAPQEIQVLAGRILTIIQRPVIDLLHLRGCIIHHGLPPQPYCAPSLRSLVWKLLLGVVSPVRNDWQTDLDQQRRLYDQYVYDLINEPEIITNLRYGANTPSPVADSSERGPVERVCTDDHPLAPPGSPWRRFYTDSEIFDQVNKDVFRTRLDMDFFFSKFPTKKTTTVTRRGRCLTEGSLEAVPTSPRNHSFVVANIVSPKTHHDRICRILFLFAKLNFGYVQGMNEIIAVIYYTLYSDAVQGHYVEADSFFAFTAIMQEHRDIFCSTMDECNSGMLGRLRILADLLMRTDKEVGEHFGKIGLKTDYFAVRWITLLLAQEFELTSVQVLWDAIMSDQSPTTSRITSQKNSLVHYLCVAMVIKVRDVLLAGDFTDCMNTLQRYPPFDVKELLGLALKLKSGGIGPSLDPSASGMSAILDQDILASSGSSMELPESPSQKPRTLGNLFNLVKDKFKHHHRR
jgi:hypothetical protein